MMRIFKRPMIAAFGLSTALACQPQPSALETQHMKRGQAAQAAGDYRKAISAFRHARELNPTSASAQTAMMIARGHLIADTPDLITASNSTDLSYEMDLMLEVDAGNAAAYHTALGHIAAVTGDSAGAEKSYKKGTEASGNTYLAHAALGQLLINDDKRLDEAKSHFEKVLAIRPGHDGAAVGIASIHLLKDQPAEAEAMAKKVLADGDSFIAHLLVGRAAYKQKKLDDAIKHFRKAVQLSPQSADALHELGDVLLAAGKPAEAEPVLREAAKSKSDAVTALGFALARQKKKAEALNIFGRLIAAGTKDPLAIYGAATMSEDLGNKDQASRLYDRILSIKAPQGGQLDAQVTKIQEDARARKLAMSKK